MNSNGYEEDEITLKEVILKIKEFYFECRKNWLIVLLFTIPFIAYQLYLRFTSPAYFSGSLTFMVNDSKGSSMGGLLGTFKGLVGEDEDKLEKILELAKTRRTVGTALFKKGTINGKMDFFANHLINIEGIHDNWKKDTILAGFTFTRSTTDSFTTVENRALRDLHQLIIGNEFVKPLLLTSTSKTSGIMTFDLRTQNEQLTIQLLKTLFESLSSFYIESTIRKEQETFDLLSAKKDSIEGILYRNDIASAKHTDHSNNLLLQLDKVPAKRYNRNEQILTAMYAEVVKNTEFAEFALKTATPYITSIDEPIPPLTPIRKGKLKHLFLYTLIGAGLGSMFVISRKIYKDAMI